jgi:hypothetical protein
MCKPCFLHDPQFPFFSGRRRATIACQCEKDARGRIQGPRNLGFDRTCLPQILANHHLTSIISQPSSSSRMQLQPNKYRMHFPHCAHASRCLPSITISPPQFLQQKRQSRLGNRGEAMPCLFSKHCRHTCGVWCNVRRSHRLPLISQSERTMLAQLRVGQGFGTQIIASPLSRLQPERLGWVVNYGLEILPSQALIRRRMIFL